MGGNFGGFIFELTFAEDRHMSFMGTTSQFRGGLCIRPNVFMVNWHEPKAGDNVVHVQDFENGVVYTNIARTNGAFLHLAGTIRVLERQ